MGAPAAAADSHPSFYAEATLPTGCPQPTTESGSDAKAGRLCEKLDLGLRAHCTFLRIALHPAPFLPSLSLTPGQT